MPTVRFMTTGDAADVARLHAESITEGFLSRLGPRFLRQLYIGVHQAEGSCVYVAEHEGRILGFCAYARDVSAMYKRVLRARFFRLGLASLPYSLNPRLLREIFDTLRYPAKQAACDLPAAEILSISVSAEARGTGTGRALLEAVYERARADGETKIKVLAGAKLDGANRFYQACGFTKVAELTQHGETLNVYVRALETTS